MPFTFQPVLRALQQPHKHSHSLQQAIHADSTSTTLHSIGFINSFRFFFFKPKKISSKHCMTISKHRQATWKGR